VLTRRGASIAAVAFAMLAWWAWQPGPGAPRDEGAIPSRKLVEAHRVTATPRNIVASSATFAPAPVAIAPDNPSVDLGTYPTRPFVARVGEEEGATDDAQSEAARSAQQASLPPPAQVAKPVPSGSAGSASDATEHTAIPRNYRGEGANDDEASNDP
jgi:hypothetical protein